MVMEGCGGRKGERVPLNKLPRLEGRGEREVGAEELGPV